MEALAALQNQEFNFSVGSYSLTATMTQAYDETVTYVGNAKSRAQLDASVAEANYVTASNRRDDVSAVSLDEEFTSLIRYQKAFEASARMVRVASEILDTIVRIL